MDLQSVLITMIALCSMMAGLGFIFNILLSPVKDNQARMEQDLKEVKNNQADMDKKLNQLIASRT